MDFEEKQKNYLVSFLDKEVKTVQKQVLDLLEIVIPSANWKPARSKILDITNDFRRRVEEELVKNYNVKYSPKTVCEDIIRVSGLNKLPLNPKFRKEEE